MWGSGCPRWVCLRSNIREEGGTVCFLLPGREKLCVAYVAESRSVVIVDTMRVCVRNVWCNGETCFLCSVLLRAHHTLMLFSWRWHCCPVHVVVDGCAYLFLPESVFTSFSLKVSARRGCVGYY
ncbi:unnamed protein product [Ectocarpus sp. 12 AP-2014]